MKKSFLIVVLALTAFVSAEARTPLRYRGSVDFGYGISVSVEQMHGFELRTVHGVDIGDNFFVGLGAGAMRLSEYGYDYNYAMWFMPLSVEGRAYVNSHSNMRLFFSAQVGSNVPISNEAQECGGIFFEPAIGMAIDMRSGGRVHLSLGFKSMTIEGFQMSAVRLGIGYAF